MYSVYNRMFKDFDEVIDYAWNTFKIDLHQETELTEEDKEHLCIELENIIDAEEADL